MMSISRELERTKGNFQPYRDTIVERILELEKRLLDYKEYLAEFDDKYEDLNLERREY
jgi:hypothetical protein